MTLRLPLYLRALALLAVNLLVLAALLIGWAGWGSVLSPAARERLTAIGERVSATLSAEPESEWPRILDQLSRPPEIRYRSSGPKSLPGMRRPEPPVDGARRDAGFRQPPVPPPGSPPGSPPASPPFGPTGFDADQRVELSAQHWWGPYRILTPQMVTTDRGREPLDVIVEVSSPFALATLLGVGEWLRVALLAIALSALVWAPFFIAAVRSIVRMQRATAQIADGHFDVRLAEARRDELGELAGSINHMAQRLDQFVSGQKRFLADTAHEVISPLARIRVGLDLLESKLSEEQRPGLQDVQDDVAQMSALLNELLLFSQAGLDTAQAPAEAVRLRALADEAAAREDVSVDVSTIDPALCVLAQRPLLLRALANLLRNAHRHGGGQAVDIAAQAQGENVLLWIRDRGPGVPPEALEKLGQPFYRPEASRSRETGGYGLGLAIVRACVKACGGEVRFRNRSGGGFEVELSLPALR